MLKTFVQEDGIDSLLSVLESLLADPQSKELMQQLADEFNKLGSSQGAVLTYAPYLAVLLSDDSFGNEYLVEE